MHSRVSAILLAAILPELVFGSCRIYPQETMAIPGKKVSLDCLYKTSIRVPYQQTYRDHSTCEDCHCSEQGLQCCGFGNRAGTFHVEGCIEKKEGCYSTFVDANDPSKPCSATQTTTQAPPPQKDQVPDSQGIRNPFASENSLFSGWESPNSLYGWEEDQTKEDQSKAQRQRQYELLLSLIQYYLYNNN